MLRLELGLVLLLAFAPGILGLLIIALGPQGGAEVEAQVLPSVVSILFEMFLSWTPVLVIGFLLARNREGWPGIGLTRLRAGDVAMGLILWVASFILVLVLAQLFRFFGQREVDFLPEGLPLWFRAIQAVLIAVTAGVTEEIVVRGYAQTRLEQLRASTAVILLLPTALVGCPPRLPGGRGGPDHLRPRADVRLVLQPDPAAVAADPGPHPVRPDPADLHPGRLLGPAPQARSKTRLKSTFRLSSIATTGPKRGGSIW